MNMYHVCIFIGVILSVGGAASLAAHLVNLLDQEYQGIKRFNSECNFVASAVALSFGMLIFIAGCFAIIEKVLTNV